jgi:hypothetical protein
METSGSISPTKALNLLSRAFSAGVANKMGHLLHFRRPNSSPVNRNLEGMQQVAEIGPDGARPFVVAFGAGFLTALVLLGVGHSGAVRRPSISDDGRHY